MDYENIQDKVESHVKDLFRDSAKPGLIYHNYEHTRYVVEKVNEIAAQYDLTERDLFVLETAAWFHDTGYLFSEGKDHEEKSVELMKQFFANKGVEDDIIEKIAGCIMVTKFPRNPVNLLQEIICDADTFNFGTKDFKETNKKVFQEINFQNKFALDKAAYFQKTYEMLRDHVYYTSYCREKLDDRKEKHLKKLKQKADKKSQETGPEITEKQGTTKGMQTMLRLTSSNHMRLSDMADSKANILISVNAIIISIILSILVRKLQTDPWLTIPTVIFLVVAVVTIVLAILATRPKLAGGVFNDDDVLTKKTNLLFFGNFHRVDLQTYERAMRSMMKDSDYLYSSLINDIYFLGVVLGRKYKLLRLAYNIFMYGIVISVLAFAAASMLTDQAQPEAVKITNSSGSPF
jgi:predicted metal-dependent HD superfamily phosphohydrolase